MAEARIREALVEAMGKALDAGIVRDVRGFLRALPISCCGSAVLIATVKDAP